MKFPKRSEFSSLICDNRHRRLPSINDILKSSDGKEEFQRKLSNLSKRDIRMIERFTRGQSNNQSWFYYRRSIITGTIVYRIRNAVLNDDRENDNINKAIAKEVSVPLYYPAIIWGQEHEIDGVQAFLRYYKKRHHDVKFVQRGLMLDEEMPFIGGSIDGLVSCNCCYEDIILEIKCAYSARTDSAPVDWRKLQYINKNGSLRKKHAYYAQTQTYLAIYKLQAAYFVVWTPAESLILKIKYDERFWNNSKKLLKEYYFNSYL